MLTIGVQANVAILHSKYAKKTENLIFKEETYGEFFEGIKLFFKKGGGAGEGG